MLDAFLVGNSNPSKQSVVPLEMFENISFTKKGVKFTKENGHIGNREMLWSLRKVCTHPNQGHKDSLWPMAAFATF